MKIITVTLAPNQAVLTCYLQDQSPKMPNAAIRPAMLVVPGGGYQYCSDREGEPVALAYMAQGFNAFVLRYTADATTPIDKALQDGAAAMDYLRANAAELEIDPQQIAAVGFSAGGHLVASLGTLLPKAQRPNALVLGYAATLGAMWTVAGRQEPDLHALVDDDTPPTFLFATQGTRWFLLRTALFLQMLWLTTASRLRCTSSRPGHTAFPCHCLYLRAGSFPCQPGNRPMAADER